MIDTFFFAIIAKARLSNILKRDRLHFFMLCLLITPKRFYIFHKFLASALEERGYKVNIVNDEYPENIVGVLLGIFFSPISKYLTYKYFSKILNQNIKYDAIIIVKGRGISKKAIKNILLNFILFLLLIC